MAFLRFSSAFCVCVLRSAPAFCVSAFCLSPWGQLAACAMWAISSFLLDLLAAHTEVQQKCFEGAAHWQSQAAKDAAAQGSGCREITRLASGRGTYDSTEQSQHR
jgi:hypothetical protein